MSGTRARRQPIPGAEEWAGGSQEQQRPLPRSYYPGNGRGILKNTLHADSFEALFGLLKGFGLFPHQLNYSFTHGFMHVCSFVHL